MRREAGGERGAGGPSTWIPLHAHGDTPFDVRKGGGRQGGDLARSRASLEDAPGVTRVSTRRRERSFFIACLQAGIHDPRGSPHALDPGAERERHPWDFSSWRTEGWSLLRNGHRARAFRRRRCYDAAVERERGGTAVNGCPEARALADLARPRRRKFYSLRRCTSPGYPIVAVD